MSATPRRSVRTMTFVVLWTSVSIVAAVLESPSTSSVLHRGDWGILTGLAQTLALSLATGVRWRWWWTPATSCGVLLTQGALAVVGVWLPLAVVRPLGGVTSALPQWLLLRRHGGRSLAWLAVAAASNHVRVAVLQATSPVQPQHDFTSWLVSTVLAYGAVALIESTVLAWVIGPDLDGAAAAERSAQPDTPAGTTRPADVASGGTAATAYALLAAVVVLLVALPYLASVIFVPELVVETSRRGNATDYPIFAGVSAPWVVALLLLPWPRLRQLGLAFAASISMLTLLPLIPWMAFWTLLSGHMLGNKDQWAMYFASMIFTVVLIALAIVASLAAWRLPAPHKSIYAWPVGVLGAISYVLAFVVGVNALGERAVRHRSDTAHRQTRSQHGVQAIIRCTQAFAVQHPERGLPTSLAEMAATGCLSTTVASGEDEGFRYSYFPGVPVASGHVRTYTACAEPVRFGQTGWYTTVVDETGVIPAHISAMPDSPGITCRGAWSSDYEKAIKFCALRYATAHPDRGYPMTLREIGPEGDGCLKSRYDYATYGEHSLTADDNRYTYVAGPRDRSGRIARYEIHKYDTRIWVDSRKHEVVNEAGERRVVNAMRLATPHDPLDAAGLHAHYDRACAGGSGEACRTLARFSSAGSLPDMEAMRDAYRRGCNSADGESCRELVRLLSKPLGGPVMLTDETRPLAERACANRAGGACLWLAQDAERRSTPVEDVERYLTSGCDAGDPASCITLGERLLPADVDRATRLLITGCSASDDRGRCKRYW